MNADSAKTLVTSNILMAIGIGAAIGILVVILIAITRTNQKVNSLSDVQDYIDAIVTVRIPFNRDSAGSVWIDQAGHRTVMAAQTRDSREFLRGDRAVVVEVCNGKVWVSHTDPAWPS